MADKITKIRIVRSCIVNGAHASEGQTFDVPKEVSEADAKYLLGIKKAEIYDGAVKAEEPKKSGK